MITTIRAFIAVAMLAGFYLLAFGIVGGLAALAIWLWEAHPGTAAVKLSYVGLAVAAGILIAIWKVARAKPGEPEGVPLPPAEATELWGHTRSIATEVGTRAPDEIRLVAEVNAAVSAAQ